MPGIRVCAFGSTRAQLLGIQAVLPTAPLIDDLRALPKDNTGYSLRDLLCGSEGRWASSPRPPCACTAHRVRR